jgi:DNA-binding MarR family transcriptional regulator
MGIATLSLQKQAPKPRTARRAAGGTQPNALDLENYVPYYINMISNKLSRGASRLYLRRFGIGVIEWRVLGFLKMKPGGSANEVCQTLAIDKAAASRAVQELEEKELISVIPVDRRQNALKLTHKGESLHDRILPVALKRESMLLAALDSSERRTLLGLLRKLRVGASTVNDYEPEEGDG